MALQINHNGSAMVALRHLQELNRRIASDHDGLASGSRLANAGTDPAGLAIADRMRARVRSVEQARRNGSEGLAVTTTAEGALGDIQSLVLRLRELATRTGSPAIDRELLQEEAHQMLQEIDRIAASTRHGHLGLLDSSITHIDVVVGANDEDKIRIDLVGGPPAGPRRRPVSFTERIGLRNLDLENAASRAIAAIDGATDWIATFRGKLGSSTSRLNAAMGAIHAEIEQQSVAESRIRDVDIARVTADLTRQRIQRDASISILAQAATAPEHALQLLEKREPLGARISDRTSGAAAAFSEKPWELGLGAAPRESSTRRGGSPSL